jgi:hypothetical protein
VRFSQGIPAGPRVASTHTSIFYTIHKPAGTRDRAAGGRLAGLGASKMVAGVWSYGGRVVCGRVAGGQETGWQEV